MNFRHSYVVSAICVASIATSALAGTQQLQLAFQPVGGLVKDGFFPVPVNPADLGSVSGTIQLFQDAAVATFFAINVNQTGQQLPGFVVDTLDAVIVVDSGVISGAFFTVIMNDGSFFQAVGGSNGSGLDIAYTDGAYTISGAITNFQMNGPTLAGVNVAGPFAAQPLIGNFFNFAFTPIAGVDFETQLLIDVMANVPIVVPIPTAMGLGTLGLLAISTRRRRSV
jgi:hypothetical protein